MKRQGVLFPHTVWDVNFGRFLLWLAPNAGNVFEAYTALRKNISRIVKLLCQYDSQKIVLVSNLCQYHFEHDLCVTGNV